MPAVLREKERPIDFGYIDTLGCNRNYFDFVLKIARNDFVAHLIAIKQKGDFIECEKNFFAHGGSGKGQSAENIPFDQS